MEVWIELLEEVSCWNYLVFLYLIAISTRALREHAIPIKKRIICFAILTFFEWTGIKWGVYSLVTWLLSAVTGFSLGWLIPRTWKIRNDRRREILHLPPSASTLILTLLFFTTKSLSLFYTTTYPNLALIIQNSASGLFIGMSIGQLTFLWKKHEELWTY